MSVNLEKLIESKTILVMPTLNEEENLKWLMPQLSNYAVIVVDNGCTDKSVEVAQSFGAEVLTYPVKGYGGAVGLAFKHILSSPELLKHTQSVVVFDADGTSPADQIETLVNAVNHGHIDLSIGQRMVKEEGAMPIHANFGNWLQTFLISLFTGYRYMDMGPMRALSVRALKKLNMSDLTWGWNVEMQMKAVALGLRIDEVPVKYKKRRHGHSKISGTFWGSVKAGTKILYAVAKYAIVCASIRRSH